MMRALWTAASGMQAQQKNIDVVANNLANVNTAGFKKSRADFQDLIYQNLKSSGAPSTSTTEVPTGIQIGLGTKLAAVTKIFTTGDLTQSGNQLDIAIEGDGFYQILQPDGNIAYTRAGAFKMDSTG
ncbi:MAG TPA: flagellar hook-basal body complex protein, partial [Clostridia bacterium]|nr:flagellar hook-basal body complex protein [Clostridia bacterium]